MATVVGCACVCSVLQTEKKTGDTDVAVEETACRSSTRLLGGAGSLQSGSNRYQNTGGYCSSVSTPLHINTQTHVRQRGWRIC